jgi:hypothetical protein
VVEASKSPTLATPQEMAVAVECHRRMAYG